MPKTRAKPAESIEEILTAMLTLNHWQANLIRSALLKAVGKPPRGKAKPQPRKGGARQRATK